MTPYWIANLVVWIVVLGWALWGALVAAFGPRSAVRRGDPMRLATALVASLFIGHTARWLWSPESDQIWRALYVVGFATALYVLRLMSLYGRGPKLDEMIEQTRG